jgi:sugar/nucleoside kinase (ribokinase family)
MAMLDPASDGPLELGTRLTLRIGGAESNFAIALARMGVEVTWVSRVGDDPLGRIVRATLEAEDVDLSYVVVDGNAPTGLYAKWREGGRTHVHYLRRGSAASRLRPEDVPDRARGITVTFDPNVRPALWESPAEAAAVHAEVLPDVDWYLCGAEEGCALFGVETPEQALEAAVAAGARDAVVRAGVDGAVLRDGRVPPQELVPVVDEVGAGDAFDAGFVHGLLAGGTPEECARSGNALAAAAMGGTGDWETLPRLVDSRPTRRRHEEET